MDKRILTEKELESMAKIFNYRGLPNRWKILENVFNIKYGDIIIDGGAFHGDMSLYFSKKVGRNGIVFACEANPNNIIRLMEFIRIYNLGNVELIPFALWDENKKMDFYFSEYPNAGSLLKEFRKVNIDTHTKVRTITIDDIVKRYKLNRLDYIWFNIEGSEVNALKGAEKSLKRFNTKLLIDTHKVNDNYDTRNDVVDYLNSIGYKTKSLIEKPGWIYSWKLYG